MNRTNIGFIPIVGLPFRITVGCQIPGLINDKCGSENKKFG
jgi:hypothetical protein